MMPTQNIAKTENEAVGVYAENLWTGAAITIASATYEVFDENDVSVQDSANATITDNSTVTPDVSGEVDCRESGFVAFSQYEVRFTITIGTEVRTPAVPIKCIEKRIA